MHEKRSEERNNCPKNQNYSKFFDLTLKGHARKRGANWEEMVRKDVTLISKTRSDFRNKTFLGGWYSGAGWRELRQVEGPFKRPTENESPSC